MLQHIFEILVSEINFIYRLIVSRVMKITRIKLATLTLTIFQKAVRIARRDEEAGSGLEGSIFLSIIYIYGSYSGLVKDQKNIYTRQGKARIR